jgi:hypothetical protein
MEGVKLLSNKFPFAKLFSSPRRCPISVVRVAGEMITNILRLIPNFTLATIYALPATASSPLILRLKNLMLKTRSFLPQNESQSHFAWQSEFLFIQEKSKLTLSPQGDVRLPNRAFSSVGYDTMTSMYDTPVRCPASREPSRFSSI